MGVCLCCVSVLCRAALHRNSDSDSAVLLLNGIEGYIGVMHSQNHLTMHHPIGGRPAQCDLRVGDSCAVSEACMYAGTDGRLESNIPKFNFAPPYVNSRWWRRALRARQIFPLFFSSLSFLFSLSAVVGDGAASVRGMYVIDT